MRSDNLVGSMLNQQCFVVTVHCATRGTYASKVNMCFYTWGQWLISVNEKERVVNNSGFTKIKEAATLGRSWRRVSCCSLRPPETSCFRQTSGRKQEEGNLVLLHNCRVNQLKRGDSYVSVSNTACALSSGELWHKKEVKTQLRSSTSSLFSCNNHIQNRELLLLFICGFGEVLLKWPKLQCLFPEFRRVVWSGSTAHRMPLRGAQQRSTYFMNYKWPQAEKQLPVCLVQPRGRNLQAKTATEIKEAKEVFCCNLRVSNFSERWRG